MPYIPHTDAERKEMLATLGLDTMDGLFDYIPKSLAPKSFNLPKGKSEFEVRRHLQALAAKNATELVCFVGGGFYDHYVPAAVDALVSRSEFYTAYTPYQPEISQGTLSGDLRISDRDLPAHRDGSYQRFALRRRHRALRSVHDGRFAPRDGARSSSVRASAHLSRHARQLHSQPESEVR